MHLLNETLSFTQSLFLFQTEMMSVTCSSASVTRLHRSVLLNPLIIPPILTCPRVFAAQLPERSAAFLPLSLHSQSLSHSYTTSKYPAICEMCMGHKGSFKTFCVLTAVLHVVTFSKPYSILMLFREN